MTSTAFPQLPPLAFSRLSFSQVAQGETSHTTELPTTTTTTTLEPSQKPRTKPLPEPPAPRQNAKQNLPIKPHLETNHKTVQERVLTEGHATISDVVDSGTPRPPIHDERYHPEPSVPTEPPQDPERTCPSRVTTDSGSSSPSPCPKPLPPLWLQVSRTRLELALTSIPLHKSRPNLHPIRTAALRSISSLISTLSQPSLYPTTKPEAGSLWDDFFRKNASLVALCHDANSKDRRVQEESTCYLLEEYHSLLSNLQDTLPHIWNDVEGWIWCAWKTMWMRVDITEKNGGMSCGDTGFGPVPMSAKSDDEYAQFLWLLTVHDSNHGLKLLQGMFARMREKTSPEFHPPTAPDSLYSLPIITRLDPRRCRVRPVPMDAHCQFRSIADQLNSNGIAIDHRRVRIEVVEWLRGHASFRLGNNRTVRDMANVSTMTDWNAYCDELIDEREAAWGNVLTLQAAAQMYRRQILVVSSGGRGRGGGSSGEVRQILPFSGMAAELAGSLYLWHWNSWCFGSCYI